MTIHVGQRWLEKLSGRTIVILEVNHRGIGPAWRYEDESAEKWHFRVARSFDEWKDFTLLPAFGLPAPELPAASDLPAPGLPGPGLPGPGLPGSGLPGSGLPASGAFGKAR